MNPRDAWVRHYSAGADIVLPERDVPADPSAKSSWAPWVFGLGGAAVAFLFLFSPFQATPEAR